MDNSKEISSVIADYKKGKIQASTIKTYVSNIKSVCKKIGSDIHISSLVTNQDKVFEVLREKEPRTRKTILASICVGLEAYKADPKVIDKYRALMLSDSEASKSLDEDQEMSGRQKKAWKPWKDIEATADTLLKKNRRLLAIPVDELSEPEKESLIDLILALVYTELPPRRLTDYAVMKLNNFSVDDDNYWDGKAFNFNVYKTSKLHGKQTVPLPKFLNTILGKYKRIFGDYLLGREVSKTQLNRRLQRIFGEGISVNLLRHVFISDNVLAGMPALRELQEIASQMGHDVPTQILYAKKGPGGASSSS
jgi:hypothetical protein